MKTSVHPNPLELRKVLSEEDKKQLAAFLLTIFEDFVPKSEDTKNRVNLLRGVCYYFFPFLNAATAQSPLKNRLSEIGYNLMYESFLGVNVDEVNDMRKLLVECSQSPPMDSLRISNFFRAFPLIMLYLSYKYPPIKPLLDDFKAAQPFHTRLYASVDMLDDIIFAWENSLEEKKPLYITSIDIQYA